ncbi:unnamed protein product [Adineta steineri]|uniref:G-protein coupled receptors family 1 profile domain-containing protein n=1 Tax=Adineta steineri TaxID=433720 RepID=A0A813NLU8_9BILA|nr:unnamed protein product [Adineta steineri]
MSADLFTLSWFAVFALIILIAFVANIIIIIAILRDKSMHTSTYFYIINVNIADILLVLSCLPERLTVAFGSGEGFYLGMFTCYLIPFCQQVAMHAALAFLLVLTIHRCYPAGVPRFLQGDVIRQQIRNYPQTLCILWIFAILVNLPLFAITTYEHLPSNTTTTTLNGTNITHLIHEPSCHTAAEEIWSRTYLIFLLVSTYFITGIFLIVIYGQAIRIILASKKYSTKPIQSTQNHTNHYRFLSPNLIQEKQYQPKSIAQTHMKIPVPHSTTTSTSTPSTARTNRRYLKGLQNTSARSLIISSSVGQNDLDKNSTNSHSTQHLQVIIMLFIVILLYILLLLPYRLLNLLYIVHNEIFQKQFMNQLLFESLLNTVRLLVFLNCALQPITYLIISSRLRQTVVKLLRSWYTCNCHCQCSASSDTGRHYKTDTRAIQAYLLQKHQNRSPYQLQQQHNFYREVRPLQTSLNNIHLMSYHGSPINHLPISRSISPVAFSHLTLSRSPSPVPLTHFTNRTRCIVSFTNEHRK